MTTSAIRCPFDIKSKACKWLNPGALILHLYGSFQDNFEDISNISYFKKLEQSIGSNFTVLTTPIEEMSSFFNSNKHFSFFLKKIENK